MRGLAALIAISSGCDSPFFASTPEPVCGEWAVDARCGGFPPVCRPILGQGDRCSLRIDASCIDPALQVELVTEADGARLVEGSACTLAVESGQPIADCGACTFTLIADRGLPWTIESSVKFAGAAERAPEEYVNERHLQYGAVRAGYLADAASIGDRLAFVDNQGYVEYRRCPLADAPELGLLGSDARTPAPSCLHALASAGSAEFVGLFERDEFGVAKFDGELALTASVGLERVLGDPPGTLYSGTDSSMSGDRAAFTILASSSDTFLTFASHLVVIDVPRMMVEHALTFPGRNLYSVDLVGADAVVVDDEADELLLLSGPALGSTQVISVFAARGSSALGPTLPTDSHRIIVDMSRGELIIEEGGAVVGARAVLGERVLKPTVIADAGELIAVGLLDESTLTAHLGFYDPSARAFLPRTIELGYGAPGRIRARPDRLYVMLPWEARIVVLVRQ